MLDWISRLRHVAFGIVEPASLDNLDKALEWIENLGTPDPDDPKKKILSSPLSGIVQNVCAESALAFMQEFSKIPPKQSPKNPVYWIAGLLFEVFYPGRRNKTGLKRACDALLKA